MKPKIAIIITRSEIGGAQKYVLSIAKGLINSFEIYVITGSEGYLSKELKRNNIKVKVIPAINSKNLFFAIGALRKVIKHYNPHLINTHSSLAAAYGRISSIGLNTKTVYSVHGWPFASKASRLRKIITPFIERVLSQITSFWITETQFDLNLGLKKKTIRNADNAIVIPNGIAPTKARPLKLNPKTVNIVFVGRIAYQKNPELALKIISELPSNYTLTIYCDNSNNQTINNQIIEYQIKNKVTLIDSEQSTGSILHAYDLLLVTSRYEGMPLSILEAMHSSIPIISSDVCGLNELITNGENGYLIASRDPQKYSTKIEELFNDKKLVDSMKIKSNKKFHEAHTLEIMNKRIKSIFEILINTN